jgi:flagellar motor switch protein FliN/FliY
MSGSEAPKAAVNAATARELLERWCESLAAVFETMADERPTVDWRPEAAAPTPDGEDVLWWEQPFQLKQDAAVWVGASKQAWEYAGGKMLRAAGVETVETAEARSTWLEILGQSLSGMARAIGGLVGREVNCGAGQERVPGSGAYEWASVSLKFADAAVGPLHVALSRQLLDAASSPAAPHSEPEETAVVAADPRPAPPARSRTMDLLLDIELPVCISFGRTQLPMKDVLKLTTGSIIELDRGINEPVEVLVNKSLIARGEVVVVEGNYGVRIQQIANRQERLRSVE